MRLIRATTQAAIQLGFDAKEAQELAMYTSEGAANLLIQNGISPNRYIWIHGDEKTAEMALKHHIQNHNGIAFFIDNKTREIPYKSTIIDPNRIFSRNGTYHALRKFQPDWAPGSLKKALDEIDLEREAFLNILMPPKGGLLIALHNNFRGYNVMDEEANSQLTSIKKSQYLRDFIICTDLKDFKKLAKLGVSTIFQDFRKSAGRANQWELRHFSKLRRGLCTLRNSRNRPKSFHGILGTSGLCDSRRIQNSCALWQNPYESRIWKF